MRPRRCTSLITVPLSSLLKRYRDGAPLHTERPWFFPRPYSPAAIELLPYTVPPYSQISLPFHVTLSASPSSRHQPKRLATNPGVTGKSSITGSSAFSVSWPASGSFPAPSFGIRYRCQQPLVVLFLNTLPMDTRYCRSPCCSVG